METKLSAIICTFNRAPALKRCLESLVHQQEKNFETIIVDGGSDDKTNQVISFYKPKLKIKKFIFREKQLAKARDLGWRRAQGEYVAWIDDDVIVSPGWSRAIIATLDRHPKIGGVTGPTIIPPRLLKNRDIFFFYQTKGLWGALGKFWENFFLEGKKYEVGQITKSGAWTPGSNFPQSLKIKGLKQVDYLEACNMTLRRALVQKVNGFDYHYTGVGEWSELDLAMRIKKLGYQLVFNPQAKVTHFIAQTGVYSRRTGAQSRMENFLRFYFHHIFQPRPTYLLKFLAYILFLNSYWAYKAVTTRNINWLGGWLGTITGLKNVK